MPKDVSRKAPEMRGGDGARLEDWLFKDRESLERRFGMEMERIAELYRTDSGKKQLLEAIRKQDPSLNGNVDAALTQVSSNIDQLKKKESFLTKMLKLPVRAVQAVGRTMKRHPFLTAAAGIAAILALLYFTGPLAQTAGQYGTTLVESFKGVLSKIGLATPEVAVEATGAVPVTGEAVGEEVARQAAEAFISPGTAAMQTAEAIEAAKSATGAVEAVGGLSGAAQGILQSPEAAKAAEEAARSLVDPLQRVLRGLPPME